MALDDRSAIERVTLAQMEARIADISYVRIGETVTICHVTLDNGYSVRGESACVDPRDYSQQVGEKLARDRAVGSLRPLFGFLFAEQRYQRGG